MMSFNKLLSMALAVLAFALVVATSGVASQASESITVDAKKHGHGHGHKKPPASGGSVGADGSSPPGANSWTYSMNPSLTVKPGEKVVFNWSGSIPHSLVQVDQATFDACTHGASGSVTVKPAALKGSYTFSSTTPGTTYFICDVTTHCAQGQKVAVTVSASG